MSDFEKLRQNKVVALRVSFKFRRQNKVSALRVSLNLYLTKQNIVTGNKIKCNTYESPLMTGQLEGCRKNY